MAQVRAAAEATVTAPADRVYDYLANDATHHPRFLQPAYSEFRGEPGGVGASTIIRFRLKSAVETASFGSRLTSRRRAASSPKRISIHRR